MKASPTSATTRRQRACGHPAGSIRPTLDPRYERCGACGLLRVAPIAAPWILEFDATAAPLAVAPELFPLFPDRDSATYLAESNAATRPGKRRRSRPVKSVKSVKGVDASRQTVMESPGFYIAFASAAQALWALAVLREYSESERLLGGPRGSNDRDAWLWHAPEPESQRPDYNSACGYTGSASHPRLSIPAAVPAVPAVPIPYATSAITIAGALAVTA